MLETLREIFFRDVLLKLFSLALAILIWLTVSVAIHREAVPGGDPIHVIERTFSRLPVLVVSSAADVRSVHVNPSEVEITVRGDVRAINALEGKDIRVMVDLTGVESARDLFKRIEVSTPAGVTHVRVVPEGVQILMPPKG
jgi:hypothetical protein